MRWPAADPTLALATAPGVQPEFDGWMLCLECGAWRRSIARHAQAHGLDAATYRERHGLRLRHPLVASDIRADHSERARSRIDADPQAWQTVFGHSRSELARYAEAGRESIDATRDRPGATAARREAWSRAVRSKSARQRGEMEDRVRVLGWPDLATYLGETTRRSAHEIAHDLGITQRTVQQWRRRVLGDVPNVGRPTDAAAAAALRRLDQKAQAAGYPDFGTLIASTMQTGVKTLSRRTGIAANTIKKYRRETVCDPPRP